MQLTKEDTEELIKFEIENAEKMYGKPVKFLLLRVLALQKSLCEESKKAHAEQERYIEVTKWNEYHESPTVSALRNRINKSKQNGFDKYNVVHRQAGRVYIVENNYFRWFREWNQGVGD